MKRYRIAVMVLFCAWCLVGCTTEERSNNFVQVEVNGVSVPGEHFLNEKEEIILDARKSDWLKEAFSDKKTVTEKDIKNKYVLVKDDFDKKEQVYRLVLLPEGFRYATPETDERQAWVQSSIYPKGWVVTIYQYSIISIMAEIIPLEDYEYSVDDDGFDMGYWQSELMDGLPIPSIKEMEIIDFPNGHIDMEDESHYSIELRF